MTQMILVCLSTTTEALNPSKDNKITKTKKNSKCIQ